MFHQTINASPSEDLTMNSAGRAIKTNVHMQKILIIDDDPDVLTVLQLLLKKKGYDVGTATKEDEAYKQIDAFMPNLIVLDVLLSGVDGRQICKKIKTSEKRKHIPVIMFSAHPGAQKNMENFGADDFLPKPFQSEKILERIEAQLTKHRQNI
jgi:DNA-binding response OmpR family regulator